MLIETWRWRFVILCIGLVLIGTGGYGLLHPDELPLNICYSRESVFLQRLNYAASLLVFLSVAASGGLLVAMVGYSVKKGLAIREDRPPVDYREIGKTVLAYLVIAIVLALCVLLLQYFLKDIVLEPSGTQGR